MAGVVVDRVDRRRLMIVADVVRGVLILGLAARQASRGRVAGLRRDDARRSRRPRSSSQQGRRRSPTSRRATELMPANALSAATWSAMLALGASVGGLVTWIAGRNVAFTVNAISFFVSAAFLMRMRVPAGAARAAARGGPAGVDRHPGSRGRLALRPLALPRGGADVRQGRLGPRRRRAAPPHDLRPADLPGGRQHGRGHRRAVRGARHRRGARADRAQVARRARGAGAQRARLGRRTS